jgi:S-methyl-5-thioribose-1-phosphate isomerase
LTVLERIEEKLRELFKIADIRPVEWKEGKIVWLDVSSLPWEEKWVESCDINRLATAIKRLEIRGAPAIGVAAALGIAMAVYNAEGDYDTIYSAARKAADTLSKTRPTAYNLFWAIERVMNKLESLRGKNVSEVKEEVLAEALTIQAEDIEANIRMGEHGEKVIRDGDTVLTHCNTGALATAGYGTALGVIRTAWRKGKKIKVIATETRPLLQGARLTAWELLREGIPFKLITDNMVGYIFSQNLADKVILGADRILLTGEVANKIGTYTIAIAAKRHGKEFYVAAPTSTIDPKTPPGGIKIEQRDPREVIMVMGRLRIAPEGTDALNPAFDVTPPELITGIITEKGIARPPYRESLSKMLIQ